MQTPAMIGAAMALRGVLESSDQPFEIHVIGTPSEESLDGGKNEMAAHGGFDHIDVAFMVHGSTLTQLETPSLALIEMDVEFHGKTAHAGIAPYAGRSAVDAVTMLQTGLGLMRNHLKDSSRVSNIVLAGGTAVNSVPDFAKVKVEIRHSSMAYLESVEQWTREIAQAAAMATQTQVQITHVAHIYNTTINDAMGALLMECAEKFACDGIAPPRKDCGSTDFGAVTHRLPSCCLRVKTIETDDPPHTDAWVKTGKEARAHQGIYDGAVCCALAAFRLVTDEAAWQDVYQCFLAHQKEN